MFSVALSHAKSLFFDAAKITKGVNKARMKFLSKAGGLVRKIATRSIRKRKKRSDPGKPPHSHSGRLKKFIFYGLIERGPQSAVVVGPILLAGKQNEGSHQTTPEILEDGGNVLVREVVYFKTGEWVIDNRKYRRRKWYLNARKRKRRAVILPRPYMTPAKKEATSKLPGMWRGTFTR